MNWMWIIPSVVVAGTVFAMTTTDPGTGPDPQSPKRVDKVVKTEAEWKKQLTQEQYRILRGHGTEAAFCGVFFDNKLDGTYSCVGCELPLFKSDSKFDSGTGWPSFFQPAAKDSIWEWIPR